MPTYDYGCPDCGHVFELFERMHDSGPRECAKCHKKRSRRRISAPAGLIFKGSGFHVTDYKAGGAAGAEHKKKTTRKKLDTGQKKSDTGDKDKTEKK